MEHVYRVLGVSERPGLPGAWAAEIGRSGIAWGSVRERSGSWLASSSLPKRTAATATGGSPLSCTERAGM